MTVSIFDLPTDGPGCMPAGMWRIALPDASFSSSFGTVSFVDGVSIGEIDGNALRRVCACTTVAGAVRVSGGGRIEIGDCSRLIPEISAHVQADEAAAGEVASAAFDLTIEPAQDKPADRKRGRQ